MAAPGPGPSVLSPLSPRRWPGPHFAQQKESVMTKVLHCSDLMHGCDYVAKADTEEELMQKAAQHAREKHGCRRCRQ